MTEKLLSVTLNSSQTYISVSTIYALPSSVWLYWHHSDERVSFSWVSKSGIHRNDNNASHERGRKRSQRLMEIYKELGCEFD